MWKSSFEGHHEGPVGEYDAYIVLAERYHWTPEQICRLEEDYITELLARSRAESDVTEAKRKKEEAKRKRRGGGGGPPAESVDASEIQ